MYIRNIKISKMEVDSEIFVNDSMDSEEKTAFHSPVLLKTTAYARLFRVSRSGRYFVIKTTKDNTARQRELLRREYELSLGCEHSHIVNILFYEYDTPVGEGIVMQYVDGCTLRQFLAANPKTDEKHRLFAELLSAVSCLHKRAVVHNDLKPENILITNNGHSLKLIDFGLAGDDAHYILKTPGYTHSYASPELSSGSAAVDVRSDIYSLGVIMKEMFGSSSIAKRCMANQPSKRYANVEALQKALSNRSRSRYILPAIIAIFLLLLPLGLYVNDKNAENIKANSRQLLLADIETNVKDICESFLADIAREVYREFANYHIISYWDAIYLYRDSNLQHISDPELNALAQNALLQKATSCYERLQRKSDSLPMFTECVTRLDERLYYYNLLNEGKPFVPYNEAPPTD